VVRRQFSCEMSLPPSLVRFVYTRGGIANARVLGVA
jgi:hypothetical protein